MKKNNENIDVTFQPTSLEEALDFMLGARERTIQNMIEAGLSEEQQEKILKQLEQQSDI